MDWIRNSHEGRRQKNQARIKAYEQLAGEQPDDAKSEAIIQIATGPRLGDKVLTFHDVCKAYTVDGEKLTLMEKCSFDVPRGGIVGVIGPNGTGKTTLFRMVIGQEKPDAGNIVLGPSVQLSYVDQHRDALDDKRTVFEEITDGKDTIDLGNIQMNSRVYLARFNFRGPSQQKQVGQCSGGERNRIHLAKMLRRGGNLVLLDEPTNDLDVNTMRVLEQALWIFRARNGHQPRPLLPRPHLHAHPRHGRQRADAVVQRQFHVLRKDDAGRRPGKDAHWRGKYRRMELR